MKKNKMDFIQLDNILTKKGASASINSPNGFQLVKDCLESNFINIFPNLLNICSSETNNIYLSIALGHVLTLCCKEYSENANSNNLISRYHFIKLLLEHGADINLAINFEWNEKIEPSDILGKTSLTSQEQTNILALKETKSISLFTVSLLSDGIFYKTKYRGFTTKNKLKAPLPWLVMLRIFSFMEDFTYSYKEGEEFMPVEVMNVFNYICVTLSNKDSEPFEKRLARSYITNNY